MLHFFATKPYLKDLIPERHVDFHSHLLPGIDDGAKTIEDTTTLIASLQQLRFEQFIATPHVMKNVWENTAKNINRTLAATNDSLRNSSKVQLRAAAEYLLDANFSELFQRESLLTINGNHVLVEMSYINPPIQLYSILFDLQVAGYKPILAHPERYLFYHKKFSEYHKLKHAGCLFQLNLLSIVGYYGTEIAEIGRKLLSNGMIDFVGSDVHHENHVAAFSRRLLFKDNAALKDAFGNNQQFRL